MPDIVWEDPPPHRVKAPWTADFAAACRKHPGKWARVAAPDGRTVHDTFVSRRLRSFGLELRTTTKNPDGSPVTPLGRVLIWARWPDE